MDDLGKNPFDEFDNEPPDDAGAVLRPAPQTWGDIARNWGQALNPFSETSPSVAANAPRFYADKLRIERAERKGVMQPGDSPFSGKPTQQEVDESRARLGTAIRKKETFDAFESEGAGGKALGFSLGLGLGLVQPENLITAGGVVAKGGATILGRLALTGPAARIAGAGLEAGAINATLDLPTQALQMGAGLEKEYNFSQTAMAFGFGQVAGSGMAGVAHLVQTRRMTAAQEAQAVDDYIRTRNGQMAGEAPDAPAATPRELVIPVPTRIVPGADADKINPEVLPRILEAAKAGEQTDGGLVRLDISPQERDALRTAGYPVSDENTVPQSVIADLARREATGPVEVTARGDAPAQTQTPATARPNEITAPSDIAGQTPDFDALYNQKDELLTPAINEWVALSEKLRRKEIEWKPEYDFIQYAQTGSISHERSLAAIEWALANGRRDLAVLIWTKAEDGARRAEELVRTRTQNPMAVNAMKSNRSEADQLRRIIEKFDESATPANTTAAPTPRVGETVTSGGNVRPAGDAGQPGAGEAVTQAGQPLPLGGRLGTTEPTARFGQQQELGPQRLSAPQAISVEPIRRDLGLDIPGTLIESPDSIKAFHGTPHDFDRFSMEKIGTGEGAQAYGHGLYFAESEGVAKSYRDELSGNYQYYLGGKPLSEYIPSGENSVKDSIVARMNDMGANADPLNAADFVYNRAKNSATPIEWSAVQSALKDISPSLSKVAIGKGSLYEIRIGAVPDKFLDWDKPFAEQPKLVQAAFQKLGVETQGSDVFGPKTGKDLYNAITFNGSSTNPTKATEALRTLGIAGIRYLDGTSRAKGEGSRNYVVFDDNLIQIVSKNGVPLKKPIPIVDYLKGEATARFGEELKAAGVSLKDFPQSIMRQAEKYVKAGERDMGVAIERAAIERERADPAISETAKKVYGDEVQGDTARPDGGGIGEAGQAGTGRQAQAGTAGTRQDVQGLGEGSGQPREAGGLDPQPLLAKRNSGPPVNPDANSRFPQRQQLQGEGGTRTLPANATPEEIASFRITEQHRAIAERLGLKLETDGRFTLKGGVLGEYKPKEGVLRIRHDGDTSVFNHELGHAIDQRLRREPATRGDMHQAIYRNVAELRALDSNTNVPSKQSEIEGVAEFIRMYLDQPAFARKQAPNFADEFDRLIVKDPELKAVMEDAYRATQIDSGMEPMQRMSSMIAPAEEPVGLRRFNEERKRLGIPSTLALNFDRFYANIVGKDRYVDRFVRLLDDAHFEKTGKPLNRRFESDPYKMFRMLPGAKQAAIDGIYNGVRGYGKAIEGPKSASLRDALSVALDGNLARMDNVDDPVVKDFNAYLVARRSRNLYDRWEAGDLRNPPVRASKNEVLKSVQDFETRYPQFVEAADKVFSYANAMWKKKFEAGMISKDVYDTVAAKGGEYVPFFRDMQDDVSRGTGGGGGAGQSQSVVKSIKGSTRDILDPIRSLMYDAAQTERIIHVNDTFKSVVKLAESGGEFAGRYVERIPNSELKAVSIDMAEAMKNAAKQAGLDPASADGIIRSMESLVGDDLSATVFRSSEITPSGERIFFVWENGERAAYKVGNDQWSKNFFETVSSMNAVERDIMLAMFGKANAMFSQFITNAPQFAIKNLIMDNMSRIFIARDTGIMGQVPGASIATGIYTQIFDREFAKSYAALGGIRGGVASAAQRDLQNQQAGKVISMSPRTLKEWTMEATSLLTDPKRFVVEVAKSPLHAIELVVKAIESTETMGRLGQAKLVQRHLEAQGVPKADAAFGAVFEARDILDYDRRGFATVGATRFMPFMNVGIQGISHANEVLMGAPLRAAIQAYQRGGYANLDGNMKAALSDAVRNWGMIAAAATMTYSYAMYMSDDPTYQAQSDYMRRRYFIFPAGKDETGRQKIVTIPKPFDTPGAVLSAVEGAVYSQRRADGKTWERVAKAMEEAGIPRQFGGLQEFLGANPLMKTGFEYVSGMKIGFDGSPSFPIVPQTLRSLPPDMQYQATTSWFAKQLGEKMGWSPMVADHVMNGLGGTSIRDANYALTAAFGDNPNITSKDAMNRVFFGALYRDAPGGGQFRSDLMKLMATDNGKYSQAARGFQRALEIGDSEEADRIYANGNETAKTLMTLRGSEKFRPADRQLHPLERTYAIGTIIGKVATDMSNQELEVLGGARRRTKKGEERNIIEIEPSIARSISNTLQSLMAEETRNGLTVAGEEGYQTYDVIDTKGRFEAIRKLSPEVAKEIETRMKAAHILPIEQVQRRWPEVKRRLLQDKNAARIGDLRVSP